MQWEIAEHTVVLTGEGMYEPEYFDNVHAMRCISCPGKAWAECNHTLWQDEIEVPVEHLELNHAVILRSVAEHLRSTGVPLTDDVVDAAETMTALTLDLGTGLDLFRNRLAVEPLPPGRPCSQLD